MDTTHNNKVPTVKAEPMDVDLLHTANTTANSADTQSLQSPPSPNFNLDELHDMKPVGNVSISHTTADGGRMVQTYNNNGKRLGGALIYSRQQQEPHCGNNKKTVARRRGGVGKMIGSTRVDPNISETQDFACTVMGPQITFAKTDSKFPPTRFKYVDSLADMPILPGRKVNCFIHLSDNNPITKMWKKKIGNYLAREVLKLNGAEAKEYTITDFPDNYILLQHRKGDKANPRTDCYLENTGNAPQFRSPAEFFYHAKWLVQKPGKDGSYEPCQCRYCKEK